MKVVLDPEAPVSLFKVDVETNKVIPPPGTPPVINPFDENALEAALKIKESQGASITVLSAGRNIPKQIIRKSLAVGADTLVLLEDNTFEDLDSYATASILAEAINKLGDYDLILCGREAADTDAGQVGSAIAEILGIPSVTVAKKVEVTDGKVRVERVTADGYEVVEASLPALITVSNELGEPRHATIEGIMAAKRKETIIWKSADIGADAAKIGAAGRRSKMLKLFQPVREGKCEMITGENVEDAAANLAKKLMEQKLL